MEKRYCFGCMQEIEDEVCPSCGYSSKEKMEDSLYMTPGTLLNDYLVGRVLGQGGFGMTYIGRNIKTGDIVAIKEYFPDGLVTRTALQAVAVYWGKEALFEKGKERFKYEADVISQLEAYPGIVDYMDYFEENGTAYFVMEYVEGITLKAYIQQRGGTAPFAEIIDLLMPAIDTIGELHRRKIIHRDINPENIYITQDKRVKLLDLGAARYASSENNQSLSIILKHGYAPKEQYYAKGNQGPWTDIYAVAATIYFALTGKTPQSSIERLEEDRVACPSLLGAAVKPAEEQVLMIAMSIKEKERYQDIKSFQKALVRAMQSGEVLGADQVTITEDQLSEEVQNSIEVQKNKKIFHERVITENEKKAIWLIGIIVIGCFLLLGVFILR